MVSALEALAHGRAASGAASSIITSPFPVLLAISRSVRLLSQLGLFSV